MDGSYIDKLQESATFSEMVKDIVLCQPCEGFEQETGARWIVRMEKVDWFLCTVCLTRWTDFGFGKDYEQGAQVYRL